MKAFNINHCLYCCKSAVGFVLTYPACQNHIDEYEEEYKEKTEEAKIENPKKTNK